MTLVVQDEQASKGLNDVLGYAGLIEGTQHNEHLPKVYLDTVKIPNNTVKVDAVSHKNTMLIIIIVAISNVMVLSIDPKAKVHIVESIITGTKHQPKCCPAFGKML